MKKLYDMEFAGSRLMGSIITVGGKPYYVHDLSYNEEDDTIFLYIWDGKNFKWINHEDDSVTHVPPYIGWYYDVRGRIRYLNKTGRRQWKMGERKPAEMDFSRSYDILSGVICKWRGEGDQIISANWAVIGERLCFKREAVAAIIGESFVFPSGCGALETIFKEVYSEAV